MQPRSRIVVPLAARGLTFGSITLATTRSGRRLGQADFELAEELATRVALAIDNARLYREAQEQAEHQSVLNVALRETVDERDRALADLQQALRTRDEFLASASHDLKNPLASIKATAQLLQRRMDRPQPLDLARMREGLQRIDAIASRAAGVVEELLDLARMQMGAPLDLDRQSADLARLTREVVHEQQTAERHPIELRLDVSELAPGTPLAGTALPGTALHGTPPPGTPLAGTALPATALRVLEVSDRGIGIPQPTRRASSSVFSARVMPRPHRRQHRSGQRAASSSHGGDWCPSTEQRRYVHRAPAAGS
jgi:signal transduction histidine kinase